MWGQQIMAKVGMSARELACLPRVTTGWLQRADCEINPTLPVILGPRPHAHPCFTELHKKARTFLNLAV